MRVVSIVAVIVATLAAGAGVVRAQSVEVSADAARGIYAKLPFSILVAAKGFDADPEPDEPTLVIDGCDVAFVGASPRVSRSMSFVNGRRTESVEVTYVYRYLVTPKKAGSFKIPPLEVKQGSRRARSRLATFEARSVAKTADMALRVGLPERPVWLGETFEATIDWYLNKDPSGPSFSIPLFESDWVTVRPLDADATSRRRQTVPFTTRDNGAGTDLDLGYTSKKTTLDGKAFTRFRFRALVTPTRAGTLELDAARVVSGLEVGKTRGGFFSSARVEVFEAQDTPRTLEVRQLPQSGRPASFKNAVGAGFSMEVTASRTVVSVGDPVELTISIKSDSRLDGMALPDLDKLLPPEHFGVSEDEPVGRVSEEGKAKVFLVTAQIKSKDVREVPRLELAYFNPSSGAYEVARSEPIALQVAGSALVGSAQVTSASGVSRTSDDGPRAISLVGADLALSGSGDTLSEPMKLGSLAPFIALLYVGPVLLVGILWWRRKTSGVRSSRTAKRARRRAIDDALLAAESRPATEAAATLASALRTLARESSRTVDGYDALIADLDAEAYNPRGDSTPLSSTLRERCEAIVRELDGPASSSSSKVAAVLVFLAGSLVASGVVHADAPALDSVRATYVDALGESDVEARQHAFALAASGFAAAVEANPGRPNLLSDWGNASLGARELGWAMLAYRRALHLDRAQPRARRNVAWVRSSLPDWAPVPDESSAVASLLFWHNRYSVAARHLGAALAFAVAVILLFAFRRRRAATSAVGGLFAVAFVALLLSALLEADRSADAVVVRDAETLRAADSPGAPAVLSRPLPAGLEVQVLETRERWNQVELADGQRGWLPRTAVRRVVRPAE